jgi:hypothetical protein
VKIGRNCVVGVNSLVTTSLPDGCLAVGAPAKVVKENAYPRPFGTEQRAKFFSRFLADYAVLLGSPASVGGDAPDVAVLDTGGVVFAGLAADDGGAAAERLAGGSGFDTRRVIAIGPGVASAALPEPWTRFDPATRRIAGAADAVSERFLNELRRYGIRFYSRRSGDRYVDWDAEPPSFGGGPESERTSER